MAAPIVDNDIEMPYSTEAEQAVLGAILVDPGRIFPIVIETVKAEFFYIDQHREIFGIMMRMFTSGEKIDAITVLNEAVSMRIFENNAEGRQYIASIVEIIPSVANVESYCKIIADKYYIRSLATIARGILSDIQYGESDAQLLLDAAEQRIYDVRQGKNVQGLVELSQAVYGAYDHIGKIAGPEREKYIGAKTGFNLLDSVISGLNKSDLIILAARPGMGKTSFALNIAENVAAISPDKEIAIFSLEMSSEQLATRMMSSLAMVDSKKLRNGGLNDDDWTCLAQAAGKLCRYRMFIDDTSGITVQQMKAKLRRLPNIGLVIIDYLQLMSSTLKTDNRVVIISEITRQMKIMAKELDVPIILLSQLSRGTEGRTDKRPMLSDLRESGSIEQDADIVMFLYREGYYKSDDPEQQNTCECIVAKNRHGETGTVNLGWNGQYTRFTNLETRANED
jgi:replicative DNA helicase